MNLVNFKWDQDADGIVTLTWDMPDRTMNVLSMAAIAELSEVADKVTADAAIKGLVITSGKAGGFCAGADLDEMLTYSGSGRKDAAAAAFKLMTLAAHDLPQVRDRQEARRRRDQRHRARRRVGGRARLPLSHRGGQPEARSACRKPRSG